MCAPTARRSVLSLRSAETMSGEKLVDHNSIRADFDEEKVETLRVQGGEFCLDDGAGAAEATPRTATDTPQVSSCTPGHDGDDTSTPAPSPGASSRGSEKDNKGLGSYATRVKMKFRRFVDVGSSPGVAQEHPVPDGDGPTPRSAGRTVTGRKDRSRANEDRFFVVEDVFAHNTPPPSPSSRPLPAEGGAAAGVAEGDEGVLMACVSGVVGKVGLYGAFDGHGGSSCANFVSRNLPQGVKNSPAWAHLAVRDRDNTTTSDHREDAEEKATTRPENQRVALGGGARGGGGLDDLLVDVMKQALLDGFRSTQEAFAAREARSGKDSGSTAIVAIVCGRHVVIANLGDSGAMFHNDQDTLGESFTAKTEFHTVSNESEKKRVEAAGGIFTANGRLFGKLQPTRSFGDQDIHRIKERVLIAVPELTVHQVQPTANGVAFLVLGSDGLWEGVRDSKVIDIVRAEESQPRSKRKPGKAPLRVAESLVKKAAKKTTDDITAVVVLFNKH